MATIDDDLAKAVTEGFRQARIDISNQDKLLTGPDDIEIELANGQKKTGPSWPKIAKLANDADLTAFTAVAGQVRVDAQQVANDKTAAGASKDAAKTSETNSKTSETNSASRAAAALASQNASKTSETNSAASAASAKADADRAQLANPDNWESAPFPDVWIPFNDSLQMLAGNGPYDRINIGSDYLELPSRSATFTRASTATYVDKSGVLQTAEVNEPRFEKEGLLIEGQSTNLIANSDPNKGGWYKNGGTIADNGDGFVHITGDTHNQGVYNRAVSAFVAGTTYTASCWLKINSGSVRFGLENLTNGSQVFTTATAGEMVRVSVTATATDADVADVTSMVIYCNQGAADFLAGRVQIETLPFATSYIPTNGAAATRAMDDCYVNLSNNMPGVRGPCSLAGEFDAFVGTDTYYRQIFTYAGTTLMIYANNNRLRREGNNNNVTITTNSILLGKPNRFGISQDGIKYSTMLNSTVTTITGYALDTPTPGGSVVIRLGAATNNTRVLFGHIRNFRIWHRALTDAQLRSLR